MNTADTASMRIPLLDALPGKGTRSLGECNDCYDQNTSWNAA